MKKKKLSYPIHKMGKNYGYDEYEDGSIKIAPLYSEQMDNIVMQEAAIDALLQSLTKQCHQLMMSLIKAKRHFWDSLERDYSLDGDKYDWSYNPCSQILSRKEKVMKEKP